jgi:tetratricopeptide (TPR) repeat protein
MGYQLLWLYRFADASETYRRGIELLGDRRSPIRAKLVGATGQVVGMSGQFDESEKQFSEAAAIAREFGDERALGYVEWGRLISRFFNGRHAEAAESGRAAVEHLRRAHDLQRLADALAWLPYPIILLGAPGEGRRLAAEALDLATRLGHRGGEILALRAAAIGANCEHVDLEQFERQARGDLERFEAIRSPWVSQSHAWLSLALCLRGDLAGSLHHADAAIAIEPVSGWAGVGWAFKFLGRALAGEVETCRTLLAEQRARLPQAGEAATSGRMNMLTSAAEGCVIVGLDDEAAALYPIVAERVDVQPVGGFYPVLAQRVAGMAATAAGLWDQAQEHFESGLRQSDEFPNRLERPQVLHWYGKMLLDRGDPADRERARTMLATALDDYHQFGMPLHAAMAQELLG